MLRDYSSALSPAARLVYEGLLVPSEADGTNIGGSAVLKSVDQLGTCFCDVVERLHAGRCHFDGLR